MCGSGYTRCNIPVAGGDGRLGIFLTGFCQVYPLLSPPVPFAMKWMNADLPEFKTALPEGLESYCAYIFVSAGTEIGQAWAGASEYFIDEASEALKSRFTWREHGWKKFRFRALLWESMRKLIQEGCISKEFREIHYCDTPVYYPTEKLIEKMSS